MPISGQLFAVYEDDPDLVDCRLDVLVPMANPPGTFSTSILLVRAALPPDYTWAHLAVACTLKLETSGVIVGA